MVSFASQPQPEPQVEAEDPPLKNPKDPFEIFDAQAIDFSFADSFLDFDSMHDWFEDKPIPDMATQDDDDNNNNNGLALAAPSSLQAEQGTANGSDPYDVGSTHAVKVEEPECENLGTSSGCAIDEGMGKISLVGGCGSSVRIEGNGDINAEIITGNEDESEDSESEGGSTSSSSSSTSYESSSSSSSDSEDEDEDEQEDAKREGPARHAVDVEFEEGELRDSDGQAVFTETAAIDDDDSENAEKMAGWSSINDDDIIGGHDDDDDGNAAKGPIRSKNELEILPSVPPVDVSLEPHHQMLPVGVVMSIVGTRVIVEGLEKHDPLNEGSILWITESRTPLGFVDEIFGPVKNPYYVVRYNSENEVPAGIHGRSLISFVPEFANHVLNNNKDLYKKGYDASGVNDEEVSDESDFSDDEKEAEYKRKQRMAKRGTNDQNPGKRKNNQKKVSPKEGAVPTLSVAPATPLLDHGHCSPFSGVGQGIFGATTLFPPTNPGPNLTTSGVWTNGTAFPQPHPQSQPALLPNGFPANVISWHPENNQISHQLPLPGNPFQQQLNPNQGFPSTTMFPGVQPNIFAQPMYAQGLVGQNQMPFGLSSPFPQIQPPMFAGQQGFLSSELLSERNRNVQSSSIPGNHHAPHQFHPGPSASRGRTFHRRGRKGWRPAK